MTFKPRTAQESTVSLGCPLPPSNEKPCERRLRRLRMLRNMLLHHDEIFSRKGVDFNLGHWFVSMETLKLFGNKSCGTAACALGSAMLLEEFQREGLRPREIILDTITASSPNFSGSVDFEAGAAFFGITNLESKILFSPGHYKESILEITPDMVAARVGELMTKYAIDCPSYEPPV